MMRTGVSRLSRSEVWKTNAVGSGSAERQPKSTLSSLLNPEDRPERDRCKVLVDAGGIEVPPADDGGGHSRMDCRVRTFEHADHRHGRLVAANVT